MDYQSREQRIHAAGTRAMLIEAARIRAELCESRGLPPSSACRAGRHECEHCAPPVAVCECDSEGGEI